MIRLNYHFLSKQFSPSSFSVAFALAGILGVLVTGCAPITPNAKYLLAPEVRTCPPKRSPDGGAETVDPNCWARVKEPIAQREYIDPRCHENNSEIRTVTVGQATNYALQVEEEYIGAKAEYGSIPGAAGLLLIPAGTSAMALGALGESATAVTSLGFGSAAILGGGYLLTNKPREEAYISGADALGCLTDTMRPFDVEQSTLTLGGLCSLNLDLNYSKSDLQEQINKFAHRLAVYKTIAGANPDKPTKQKLCYAEKLLKAANTTLQAATSAYDSGTKYYDYSYDNAGNEMVSSVKAINNKVNGSMTASEPNLQKLAGELSTVIPESAQKLAGIDKNATETKAAVGKAKVAIAKALSVGPKSSSKTAIDGVDADARSLYRSINLANNAAEEVVNRTPSEILPKAKDCMKVFDKPGTPPDMLILNPDVDIQLSPGDSVKIAISGGQLPYSARWLCDCYNSGVTAQISYEGAAGTLSIAAVDNAKADSNPVSYSLEVSDSTGAGRSLRVVVLKKVVDSADTPDCELPSSKTQTLPAKGIAAGSSMIIAVAHAVSDAEAAADQAKNAARKAEEEADKAEELGRGGKRPEAIVAFQRANDYMVLAFSASSAASRSDQEARVNAGNSKDPALTKLIRSADAAADQAAKSAFAAGHEVVRAKHWAS